jgi:hypothetical protein
MVADMQICYQLEYLFQKSKYCSHKLSAAMMTQNHLKELGFYAEDIDPKLLLLDIHTGMVPSSVDHSPE